MNRYNYEFRWEVCHASTASNTSFLPHKASHLGKRDPIARFADTVKTAKTPYQLLQPRTSVCVWDWKNKGGVDLCWYHSRTIWKLLRIDEQNATHATLTTSISSSQAMFCPTFPVHCPRHTVSPTSSTFSLSLSLPDAMFAHSAFDLHI